MPRNVRLGALVLAFGVFAAGCEDDVGPEEIEEFVATLNGANERPTPVTTPATGTATFSVVGGGILYRIDVADITGVIAAHIHGPAGPTVATGIIVGLYSSGATGAVEGTLVQGVAPAPAPGVSFDSLLVLMRNGNSYVNVHTSANPGGEIRGQIGPR